jgi:SAM-dependent methyltransferase
VEKELIKVSHAWAWNILNRFNPKYKTSGEIYGDLLLKYLSRKTFWLDAGCGKNQDVEKEGRKVDLAFGVDEEISYHGNKKRFIQASLEQLPFKKESFHLVTCKWVVEHLKNPERVFQEFSRVLIPEGALLIYTSNLLHYWVVLSSLLPLGLKRAIIERIYNIQRNEVFQTYHRFNFPFNVKKPPPAWGFRVQKFVMNENLHFFSKSFFLFSLLYERLTSISFLKFLRINILAVYQK